MLKSILRWAFRPRTCKMCDKPRVAGLAFCSNECHTEWRVATAVVRGAILSE